MKYRSFYISSFQILTPTPVGVQISEDVPVLGEFLVAEGIRVPEDIRVSEGVRVPAHFRVLDRKKLKLPDPTRPEKIFYPHTPINYVLQACQSSCLRSPWGHAILVNCYVICRLLSIIIIVK